MPKAITEANLRSALTPCLVGLRQIAAQLNGDHIEATDVGSLGTIWDRYYFREFAQFDVLLRSHVVSGGNAYEPFLPISITHHNLHRLIEVLRTEIGDGPLGTTRVPERLNDLSEVSNRLMILLEDTSASEAIEGSIAAQGSHHEEVITSRRT
jgi:hypothetical protein